MNSGGFIVKDLTNLRMHKLVALRFLEYKNKHAYWEIACDCGKVTTMTAGNFTSGKVKSCGCQRFKQGNASPYFKGTGDLSRALLCKIRECAKRRKIPFEVEVDYLWAIYQMQKGNCALTGQPIVLPKTNDQIYHGVGTASLDRIDSSKGYLEGNVQWVHKNINMMKQSFAQEEFISLCKLVVEHKGDKS